MISSKTIGWKGPGRRVPGKSKDGEEKSFLRPMLAPFFCGTWRLMGVELAGGYIRDLCLPCGSRKGKYQIVVRCEGRRRRYLVISKQSRLVFSLEAYHDFL